ncbi:hypothetical protein L2E82_20682 [Cichorium intybus]|uniref:Uncharacterized protein n=1 Tax=Cichorium intybus TaxID=13427 RepID=A0ACB9DUB6_CICIN|nr:hypothetical protein L2E82_20682 [Cichorium intybus]
MVTESKSMVAAILIRPAEEETGYRLTTSIAMELTSSEADFAAKAATEPDASAAGEIDALIRSEFKIKSSHREINDDEASVIKRKLQLEQKLEDVKRKLQSRPARTC